MSSELPASWTKIGLGDFAPFFYGKGLPERARRAGSIPVISSAGVVGTHAEALVDGGVIIGRKGSIGSVFRSRVAFWPIDTTFYVTRRDDADFEFTFWLLKSLQSAFEGMNSDSAVPGLNRDAAHQIAVPVPPLPEQRRIAWVLGSLDDKIELNRRLARTLEEIAAAIFKARFIDFEGVTEFEDSEIGLIPKGWQVSTAGEELDPVGGGTPDTKHSAYWDDDGYEWATPKDLSGFDGQFLVDTSRRLSELGASKISSGLLPEGSVLLSSRAPVGYTAIAGVPMAINQGFIAVRPNESFGSAYVLLWLRSQLATIRRRAGGTTFAEISKKAFRPIPFLVPDTHSLSLFDEFVTPVFAGIRRAEAEMRTLVGVRDALLPKLISGRVRVPEGAGPDVDPLAEAA